MLIASTGDSYIYPFIRTQRDLTNNNIIFESDPYITKVASVPGVSQSIYPAHNFDYTITTIPYAYYYLTMSKPAVGGGGSSEMMNFFIKVNNEILAQVTVQGPMREASCSGIILIKDNSCVVTIGNPASSGVWNCGAYDMTLKIYQASLVY